MNESVFWTNRVNQWFKDPFIKTAVYWIPELISHLNESNEDIYCHLLADLVSYLEYHLTSNNKNKNNNNNNSNNNNNKKH